MDCNDQTLAEFILALHEKSGGKYLEFLQALKDNGADFSIPFTETLHRIITQMTAAFTQLEESTSTAVPSTSTIIGDKGRFSGLSLPNDPNAHLKLMEDLKENELSVARQRAARSLANNASSKSRDDRQRQRSRSPRDRNDMDHRDRRDQSDRHEISSRDYDRRDRRRSRAPPIQKLDDEPIIGKVYDGRVTTLKDFGAFCLIDGIRGRREGLIHISMIVSNRRLAHPDEVLERGQKVKVKVDKVEGTKIGLNLKDIDQGTGEDLSTRPQVSPVNIMDTNSAMARPRRRIASPELWEIKQLIASGVLDPSQYPTYDADNDGTIMQEDEMEEELDIELRDDEPVFLKGQTSKTLDLSPIKVLKAPDGSLNRAALAGASLAKERKDMKFAKQSDSMEAKVKELSQAWADPMADEESRVFASTVRAQSNVQVVPEWKKASIGGKKQAMGRHSSMSVRQQRESLPIYKLRRDLISAVTENQILVVIGDTG